MCNEQMQGGWLILIRVVVEDSMDAYWILKGILTGVRVLTTSVPEVQKGHEVTFLQPGFSHMMIHLAGFLAAWRGLRSSCAVDGHTWSD